MADGSGEIDLKALPKMVRWYSPAHLVSTGWRSVVSEIFGQYADQRIMQATIDGFAPEIMKTVVVKEATRAHQPAELIKNAFMFWTPVIKS